MASGRWNTSKKLFFDDDDIARLTGTSGSPNIDVEDSACLELPQNFRDMPDDEPRSGEGTSTFPSSAISAPIFTPRHSFPVRDVPLAVTSPPELSLCTLPSDDVAISSPLRSSLTPEAPTFYPRRSTNYWANVSLPEVGMFPPIRQPLTRVDTNIQTLPSTFTTETGEAFSGGGFTELSVRREAQTSRSQPFFVASPPRRMLTGDLDATTTQLENLCSLLEINASLSSHCSAPPQHHQPRPTWPPGGPGFGRDHMCTFCRRNGERQSVYTSHALKDANGNVICPILRRYVCPICRETGDNAHTVSYCPRGRGISTVVETPRKSCGCTRNCLHGVNRHH